MQEDQSCKKLQFFRGESCLSDDPGVRFSFVASNLATLIEPEMAILSVPTQLLMNSDAGVAPHKPLIAERFN